MTKRDRDYDEDSSGEYGMKILVGTGVAGSIIGKGGRNIAEIKEDTGTRMYISGGTEFFPGTQERVVLMLGSPEAVKAAVGYVLDKIEEPLIHRMEKIGEDTSVIQLQVTIALPATAVGCVIGKKWAKLKEIEQESRTRMNVSQGDQANIYPPERLILVKGTRDGIHQAIEMVLDKFTQEDPALIKYQNMNCRYNDVQTPRMDTFDDFPPSQRGRYNDYPSQPQSSYQSQSNYSSGSQLSVPNPPAGVDSNVMNNALQLLIRNPSLTVPQAMQMATASSGSGGMASSSLGGGGASSYSGLGGSGMGGGGMASDLRDRDRDRDMYNGQGYGGGGGGYRSSQNPRAPKYETTVEMHVPNEQVGALIGRAGVVVSEINRTSGANLNISRRGETSEGNNRVVTIKGTNAACERALQIVNQKLEEGYMG